MRYFFITIIIILFSSSVYSDEGTKIDSLEKEFSLARTDSQRISALVNLSYAWESTNTEKSFDYARRALSLALKIKHIKGQVNSYSQLGNYYMLSGQYDKALKALVLAQKLVEDHNDKRAAITIYINIGNVFAYQGNWEVCLMYFKKALNLAKELKFNPGIATATNNIAGYYFNTQRLDSCRYYLQEYINIVRADGDMVSMGHALSNMGGLLASTGNTKDAFLYYDSAMVNFRKFNDYTGVARILTDAGQIKLDNKLYKEALPYLLAALDTSTMIRDKLTRLGTLRRLSKAYAGLKDFELANRYNEDAFALKDSMFNEDMNKQLAEVRTKYDTEKKDKELLKQKAELNQKEADAKQRETERNALVAGLVLLAGLAFFIWRGYAGKRKANLLLGEQKAIIEARNKDITDSINYARKIQESILPEAAVLEGFFPQNFILFKPRDIVSGDFYWFCKKGKRIMVAVADCTGHGVPGALMSMVGSRLLNEIAADEAVNEPGLFLKKLNDQLNHAFAKQGQLESRDGMDIALIIVDPENNTLQFSGANRPLYLVREGMLEETSGSKVSIGGEHTGQKTFHTHTLSLRPGDCIYLCSDGYADQFGGEAGSGKAGKKMMTKNFKKYLEQIHKLSLPEQKKSLAHTLESWQGDFEQVDDILVIGIRN